MMTTKRMPPIFFAVFLASAAARSQTAPAPSDSKEFEIHKTEHKATTKPSKIKSSATEAALRFTVVDKKTEAGIPGVVVLLTAPDGKTFYADETDADGESELLVPISQTYDITYLSLGHSDVTAKAAVDGSANHNIHLTLRFQRSRAASRVVLEGLMFDTGKAQIRPDSLPRLDQVFEYLAHKKSARIEISGHTDNVGNAKGNKDLSLRRAQSCRDYLVSKGIDASRIVAV